MYAFRRALWARDASLSIKSDSTCMKSVPLSVSRNLARPFVDKNCSTRSDAGDVCTKVFDMLCTGHLIVSSVAISPTYLNFGECNVGDFKSESIVVINNSTSTAIIVPYFESNTITLSTKYLILKAGQSSRVTIDYVVHVVDSGYSKVIRFINLLDPATEVNLEIRARNVDTCQMLLHDVFYKLNTYSGSKQIILYSKQCVFRRPCLRIFSIRNVYSEVLCMKLTSDDCSEVAIYSLNDVTVEADGDQFKELRTNKSMTKQQGRVIKHQTKSWGHERDNMSMESEDPKSKHIINAVNCFNGLYRLSSDVSKTVDYMIANDSLINDSVPQCKTGSKGINHSYAANVAPVDIEDSVVRQCDLFYNLFKKVSFMTSS